MNEDVELKVCMGCDAPLPYKPVEKSYFSENKSICDDCLKYKRGRVRLKD